MISLRVLLIAGAAVTASALVSRSARAESDLARLFPREAPIDWVSIVVAVIVLGGLALRLARSDDDGPQPVPPPPA